MPYAASSQAAWKRSVTRPFACSNGRLPLGVTPAAKHKGATYLRQATLRGAVLEEVQQRIDAGSLHVGVGRKVAVGAELRRRVAALAPAIRLGRGSIRIRSLRLAPPKTCAPDTPTAMGFW